MKKSLALILAALLLGTGILSSCGQAEKEPAAAATSAESAASETVPETEAPNILDGLDFEGRSFRIQMSNTDIGSCDFLEGFIETTGDVAYDAVYERNIEVMERLNVNIEYTDIDLRYDKVAENVRTIVMAGEDSYDLLVNDQLGFSTASVEKLFINALDCKYFDFEQPYWWNDYMHDFMIGNNNMYLLVGDYFIDVLRRSHAIYYSRDIFNNLYGDPDAVYQQVIDGKWTYDTMNGYITGAYSDLNGDGNKDKDDRYGMVIAGIGGSIFPYEYCGDPDFVTRDDEGVPSITMLNDRTDKLYSRIYNVFYNDSTYTKFEENSEPLYNKFISGTTLFISTVFIGDFDRFRSMETEIGILPYPKLDEEQTNYVTCIHDTAEVGAIPLTCGDPDFASAVIQALCEESGRLVIPAYYETALKIKYARDDYSSQMIDIIHDGITGLFPLIYGGAYANNIFTWALLEPLQKGDESWVSSYESRIEVANTQLKGLIDSCLA